MLGTHLGKVNEEKAGKKEKGSGVELAEDCSNGARGN